MKYILLKNGRIVHDDKLVSGNILIGNDRIIEIGDHVKAPHPYSEIIDLSNKYLLPGLIHYNCSILKLENNEPTSSAIYIALSHGATFLMDTVKIQKETPFSKTINFSRESCKPIIADYGFHLRAHRCCHLSEEDLLKILTYEGISSFYIKLKDIKKLLKNNLNCMFDFASKSKLLYICETKEVNKITGEKESLFSENNIEKFNFLMSVIKKYKYPFLFTGITTWEELDKIFQDKELNDNIFASVHLSDKCNKDGTLNYKDLEKLVKNPNIILAPPELIQPDSKKSSFIENAKTYSFLSDLICREKSINEDLLLNICEMYATRPAKLLGIYPQKGVLDIGTDADFIVWNPAERNSRIIGGTDAILLRKDIYAVIMKGKMVTDDIEEIHKNLSGKFLFRN
ncbi:MAG: amidohydrolase family protein [Marinilabiliaceae bacterium]|nr:amidohydrolase family protein [Marinilabiliaceae bacterium]